MHNECQLLEDLQNVEKAGEGVRGVLRMPVEDALLRDAA
jgi:hypothetical protein